MLMRIIIILIENVGDSAIMTNSPAHPSILTTNTAYGTHPSNVTTATIKQYLIAAALGQSEMVCYYLEAEGLPPDITWGGKPTAIC